MACMLVSAGEKRTRSKWSGYQDQREALRVGQDGHLGFWCATWQNSGVQQQQQQQRPALLEPAREVQVQVQVLQS